jgi:hypothetical protein
MNPVNLKPTATTPAITISEQTLSISGRSIPLSEPKFFDPYIEWAKNLKCEELRVDIKLEYMNSSSAKKLLQLLKSLDTNKDIYSLKIFWYYEEGDEELKDNGHLFEKLLKKAEVRIIKFNS